MFGLLLCERKSSASIVEFSIGYDNFLPFPNESRWYKIYQWLERTHTAAKHWNKWFDFDLIKKLLHDKKKLKNIVITFWKMFESYLSLSRVKSFVNS